MQWTSLPPLSLLHIHDVIIHNSWNQPLYSGGKTCIEFTIANVAFEFELVHEKGYWLFNNLFLVVCGYGVSVLPSTIHALPAGAEWSHVPRACFDLRSSLQLFLGLLWGETDSGRRSSTSAGHAQRHLLQKLCGSKMHSYVNTVIAINPLVLFTCRKKWPNVFFFFVNECAIF